MTRLTALAWLAALFVSTLSIGAAARQLRSARLEAKRAHSSLNAVLPQVREIATLRAATPDWSNRAKPSTALAPAAAAVVASCGLPEGVLSNVAPDSGTRIGEGPVAVTRQRATLTLLPITLPEVGRFLAAWREAEPDWTVVSIDLAPQHRATVTPGGDLPLRAVLVIEAFFMQLADSGGKP